MFGHPGKKLLFMGRQDFRQLREWSEERDRLVPAAMRASASRQTFFSDLLKMYRRKYPALYANDCATKASPVINANDGDRSILQLRPLVTDR